MASAAKERPTRRKRRSTEEIVDRIIEAASEEFEEKGYLGATTASIAKKADVAEALLFTNFGSKAALFQSVIFKPLDKHFDRFLESNPVLSNDVDDCLDGSKKYISELHKFVSDHAGMIKSLVSTQMYKADGVDGVAEVNGLEHYFERMASVAAANLSETPMIDPAIMARISFLTLMSSVLFKDWIFGPISANEDQIRKGIVDYVLFGLSANKPVYQTNPDQS